MPFEAHDQPSYVVAEQGAIIIGGRASAVTAVTVEADEPTDCRLLADAALARSNDQCPRHEVPALAVNRM